MKRRLIEPYKVVRKRGAGGSGVAYLASDTLLMRPVVLKILKRGTLSLVQPKCFIGRQSSRSQCGSGCRSPQ
jgi:eukaryotic-like serine/threonine-protein kinase